MARPKKIIDYDLVEKLAFIQCTEEEIAMILEISTRTLQRDEEFCRIYHEKKHSGKSSLRRLQWKTAESGNPTMQIWLGKQYLGQKDKQESETRHEVVVSDAREHLTSQLDQLAERRRKKEAS